MFDQYDALEASDRLLPMEVTIKCQVLGEVGGTVSITIPDVGDGRVYAVSQTELVRDD